MEILLTGKDAEKLAVKSFTSLTHFTYDYELNSRPFFISISGFCDDAAAAAQPSPSSAGLDGRKAEIPSRKMKILLK